MSDELPEYYFRVRDNGATVFRVATENRLRRIELEEIASVNTKNGNIRAHGERKLTPEEETRIRAWLTERQALLARRDIEDIHRAVDMLNATAHWAQSKASPDQLAEVTETLLLAMHDLRGVLVRKKSEQLSKAAKAAAKTGAAGA